jgi:hypothetical protein
MRSLLLECTLRIWWSPLSFSGRLNFQFLSLRSSKTNLLIKAGRR